MFGTSGIRGPVGETVTADLALSVGRSVASEGYRRVVVGRDTRESGSMLVDALTAGLRECGAEVYDVGVVPTPTVARAVCWTGADAGIVVTASHNPATDNGFKLWTSAGKAFGPDRRHAIEQRIRTDEYDLQPWDEVGSSQRIEWALERHEEAIAEAVSIDDPVSVVVDVGNGVGSITARVLTDLGCDVVTLNAQEDGSFPGRESEPTRESLEALGTLVGETNAAVGLAHDGDADRLLAVDETGSFVPKDVLLALFAREAAAEGDTVVTPVDTSLAVDDAVGAVGASVTRTRVGDAHVAQRVAEEDAAFGGEPSGAWIWPGEALCPDGPLAACTLVELIARHGSLSTLVAGVETYPIRRASIETQEKDVVMDRVRDTILEREDDVDTVDGVRVDTGDGWYLVRKSGTEPLVRVTAEARTPTQAEQLYVDAVSTVERAMVQCARPSAKLS
ncbi:phosphoglucosamine mutase [Natrialbaceae archaeon A-gly3]